VGELAASGRRVVADATGQLLAVRDGGLPFPAPARQSPAFPPREGRPDFLPKPRKPRAPLRERVAGLLGWRRTRPRRRLEAEELVQVETVRRFDAAFLAGADVLILAAANESRLPLPGKEEAARNPVLGERRRWLKLFAEEAGRLHLAMGLLKGATDSMLLFRHRETGEPVAAFLECKRPEGPPRWSTAGGKVRQVRSPPGSVSPEQEAVLELLWSWRFPVGVYHSPEEAFALARGWGAPV
jgi:hypothetical protein